MPQYNTRIQLKSDTEANWNKVPNFVPLDGEFIIYSVDNEHSYCRLKVGDGTTTISNLSSILILISSLLFIIFLVFISN